MRASVTGDVSVSSDRWVRAAEPARRVRRWDKIDKEVAELQSTGVAELEFSAAEVLLYLFSSKVRVAATLQICDAKNFP